MARQPRTISGGAKLAGVMGWPVRHSRSPQLHGYWLARHEIDGAYVPLAVPADRFEDAFRALAPLGFAGVNLTVPYKEAALKLVDEIDDIARRIGAINTVIIRPDGRYEGRNTDAYGFLESLRHDTPAYRPNTGPAVVIGAGGAARAIVTALVDLDVPEIRVVNRTLERAERLASEIGGPTRAWGWERGARALDGAALLVNSTTLGMAGQPALDLDLARLPPEATVFDIVYVPLETPLLAAARQRGNHVVDGLGMLLHQGRPGFRAWFGVDPKVTPALRAYVVSRIAA
ncbi:MAG TPA: shikimate dehydrogenase [Alphaproteobacteria bacterium]|nr:shikimate dehydrogenase [Alphaproteobacteria bacterium]